MRSFPTRTRERIARLASFLSTHVLADGRFRCRHAAACRASRPGIPFYEGQLHHVGPHYDLEIGGRPLRIVILGQDYGHGEAHVGLARRSEMIASSASVPFADRRRNPHMRGTASILRLLLGREPGRDPEGELLDLDQQAHVFDAFALVNFLMCSAIRPDGKDRSHFDETFAGAGKSDASPLMRRNCAEYLRPALEILEPTVLVVQGQGVRRWAARPLGLPAEGRMFEQTSIGGATVDILTFDHPSAPGKSGWWGSSPESRYLREVVGPTVKAWRAGHPG